MYRLIKASRPGWEREFKTQEDLLAVLEGCICNLCFPRTEEAFVKLAEELRKGGEEEQIDDHIDPVEYATLSVEEKIDELLFTGCGCEYFLGENE